MKDIRSSIIAAGLLFSLLLNDTFVHACINEYHARIGKEPVFNEGGSYPVPYPTHNLSNTEEYLEQLTEYDSAYKKHNHIEHYSDYGVMLIYLGRFEEAKRVFIEIEHKKPGLYNTAANLGTVYEVLGKNDSALYWIKRAMEINPGSHHGSEWIHVKLLEAKLKAGNNESYLWKHSILGINFGDSVVPVYKGGIPIDTLVSQLYYQLSERISFIKPRDPVIAQLLFDLGNATALAHDVVLAVEIYDEARKYGYESTLLNERAAYFKKLQEEAEEQDRIELKKNQVKRTVKRQLPVAAIGLALGILLAFVWFIIRRRKKDHRI